jgi:hypothetical protein
MAEYQKPEFARGIRIPFPPDRVLSPELIYRGTPPSCIYYVTAEDEPIRVTFEGLDAIKGCRGEFLPYPSDDSVETGFASLYIVENSRWLRERHAYEARYYRNCYEWGGDVDEMLTDYDHYLLSFHDEFIEWIGAGIWFEKHPEPFSDDLASDGPLPHDHPLSRLPLSTIIKRFVVDGITCQVRANPKPMEVILQGAYYCSQPVFEFVMELDGHLSLDYRVEVRERRGSVKSRLRNCMGTIKSTHDGVVTSEQARALVEPYIREVSERRRERGM